MSPEVCFSRPAIIRSKVVFPQPLGPSRTRYSPSLVARSTPSTAIESPKRFLTSRVSTIANLNQLLLLPLRPDFLALRLGFLDRVLGGHFTFACLGKHGVEHPGGEDFVDRCGGVAGIANVGRPVERIGEHLVLVRRLALGVLFQQLSDVRHPVPEAREIV